jgi:drug/metabolite transporter (DMT)-like permease
MEVLGIVISSAGTILLTLPGDSFGISMNRGDVLSFLCAVLFALHIVVTGHYSPISGFESLAVIQAAVVAVLGLSAASFVNPTPLHLNVEVAVAVVVTGLFATALAFTTMAWAQQYTSPTRTALIFTLEPAVAALTSWVLIGETLTNRGKVGAGLILTGILVGELTRGRVETVRATGTS